MLGPVMLRLVGRLAILVAQAFQCFELTGFQAMVAVRTPHDEKRCREYVCAVKYQVIAFQAFYPASIQHVS